MLVQSGAEATERRDGSVEPPRRDLPPGDCATPSISMPRRCGRLRRGPEGVDPGARRLRAEDLRGIRPTKQWTTPLRTTTAIAFRRRRNARRDACVPVGCQPERQAQRARRQPGNQGGPGPLRRPHREPAGEGGDPENSPGREAATTRTRRERAGAGGPDERAGPVPAQGSRAARTRTDEAHVICDTACRRLTLA